MRKFKYIEANIPDTLRAEVRYLKDPVWVTTCQLIEEATGICRGTGLAVCSVKDQPVRKIGRAMAVGRALKNYVERLSDGN